MATTKAYRDFILEQLDLLENITCRSMMGEYLLYYHNVLFGGIYDERLLVKVTDSNHKYQLPLVSPYKGARDMYFVTEIDDKELIRDIILDTCRDLKEKKGKQ